ncbi:hypothetical protein LTR99_002196 [Exophiala xenobiotica]|uniref:Fun14 family protein n=1 Tax=Vermiconidia calcicola TaxID=1690605 RepID=A0AAV9QKH8_9PEZI|nr:hypothetical protein H2202_000575 [Exophiala xenobiotica]KAK5542465.1 hypothetical protein LTR25_002350 [Vermiconidia calcicola]KAK5546323.1 hypothetical protein LTR23_003774 [Chaetothyriales sp. CCFEE 6169]KAK5195670.1 hypothetical protein LTR92_004611 [Exophiala xenobiotica]KAK5226024.1 hypothetical protein LTR72_003927 [Exophiala xenobiotica]
MLLRTAIRPSTFRSIAKSIPATPVRSAFNRPVAIAFGLSLGATPFLHPRTTARLDTSPSSPQAAEFSTTPYTHSRDARTPLTKDGRSLNPAAVKQISLGAILGLGAGVLLSAFSRMLTLIIGLGIVIWQYAARKGYNFIPVDRMQRHMKNINLRSAINDNVAFKISFGLMFALTAFGEF